MAERFDVLIAGAGIAGGTCAALLAKQGVRVLLADRARFPRPKVCGGCLDGAAVEALRAHGFAPGRAGFDRVRVAFGSRHATSGVRPGVRVERSELDFRLTGWASEQGAVVRDGAGVLPVAQVGDARTGPVRALVGDRPVEASLLIDASGLSGLDRKGSRVAPRSRFGVGAIGHIDMPSLEPEAIAMHVGSIGYVGMCRIPGGLVNIAAALDPVATRRLGGPAPACAAVLGTCGIDCSLDHLTWRGTPLLSRSRVAGPGERVLRLGDAGGYVEPFTGEGMGWAVADAIEAARLIAVHGLSPEAGLEDAFARWSRRARSARTRRCRVVRSLARSPMLTRAAIGLLGVPAIGGWLAGVGHGPRGAHA